VTNNGVQPEQLEALSGWVENKSDQQISAVVFDVIVSQPGTGLEALRERVWLGGTVFKTEKASFTNAQDLPSSQIWECLRRNTNYIWSGEIVTAVPQARANEKLLELIDYYKIKSIWCRTK
jgi:hypothetical protein